MLSYCAEAAENATPHKTAISKENSDIMADCLNIHQNALILLEI